MHDIGIIGAGPSGLFVPFIAGMKGLSCIIFESLEFVGGQCTALYPEKPIYDIPAMPQILASDLVENLKEQSARFNPQIMLEESIISYKKEGDIFVLQTSKQREFKVKSIIIATGGGRFTPNRPPLKSIQEYEGKSVFYAVKNKSIFEGKKVVIAGGGDSAVDWALSLCEVASKVYFVHRRDKFKASIESVGMLEEMAEDGKLEFVIPFQLESLEGENGFLKAVNLFALNGEKKRIEADFLLPFFGLMTDNTLAKTFNLEEADTLIKVEQSTMQTSVKGIYAIGDIAHYKNKLKLILTSFTEGAHAVYDIKKSIYPDVVEKFEYSTTMFK